MSQKQIKIIFIIIEMDLILNTKVLHSILLVGLAVEVTGQIIEKIGPILATKYSEIN